MKYETFRDWIVIYIITFMLFVVVYQCGVYFHEQTHRTVANNYGCIDSTIDINFLADSYFQCHEYQGRTDEMKEKQLMLDSLNEVIWYNLNVIIALMFVVTTAYMVINLWRVGNK